MPPQQQPPYGPLRQPQHPQPVPDPKPAQPASQYDFIMNHEPPKPARKLGGDKKGLLFIVIIAAVVIMIVALVFAALSGGGSVSESFITVAQRQQELGRVADLQYTALKVEKTKDLAINTKLTMATDQAALTNYLADKGVKVSPKDLALGTNSTTDTKFTQAIATSTLDETVTKELQDELTGYKHSLSVAYGSTTSTSTRKLLQEFNTHADLLLAQSKQ